MTLCSADVRVTLESKTVTETQDAKDALCCTCRALAYAHIKGKANYSTVGTATNNLLGSLSGLYSIWAKSLYFPKASTDIALLSSSTITTLNMLLYCNAFVKHCWQTCLVHPRNHGVTMHFTQADDSTPAQKCGFHAAKSAANTVHADRHRSLACSCNTFEQHHVAQRLTGHGQNS